MSRRTFLGAGAGFAAAFTPDSRLAAQGRVVSPRPVRIGCLVALSGAQERVGRPVLDGAQIAADQINEAGGLLGRMLELVPYDTHGDTRTVLQGAKELEDLGVNLLCGALSDDAGLALAPTLQPSNAVLIACAAASEKLTHEAYTPHLFHVTDQTITRSRAQALLMAERYPDIKRWGAIIPASEHGACAYESFRAGLQETYPAKAGRMPELAEPVVSQPGKADFKQAILELGDSEADGLFIAIEGDDAISFYRQMQLAGLTHHLKVLADATNELLIPLTLGTGSPEHLWLGVGWYYGGYQRLPLGKRLHQDYLQCTGNGLPPGSVNAGHSAVLAYAAAVKRASVTDTLPVMKTLEGLTFDTAKGLVTLRREDHQAICDVNFIRIKTSETEPTMDILDGARPDVEVVDFVRFDGASVIERPGPGKAVIYGSRT